MLEQKKTYQNEFKQKPQNIPKTIKQLCRYLMRENVPTGFSAELTFAPYYKSKTAPKGTYEGNLLKKQLIG